MQHELTEPSPLLNDRGELNQVGWARQPLLDCNLENAHFYSVRPMQFLRIKQWDYYGVTTPEYYFSITLADVGYIGQVFAYTLDFESGAYHEETLILPLSRGVRLPRNSTQGDSLFDNGRVRVAFHHEPGARRLELHWPGFRAGAGLAADVTLRSAPDHESTVIVIPIGQRRFYYNRKMNCLPAKGWIQQGEARTEVRPTESLGNMDWGRGVWQYNSFWVWASASAFLPDGRTLGLNMGFGFGDTSAATENTIIVDGRVHKLGNVDFDYDATNFMRPWTMKSDDDRLDLVFTPFKDRVASTNMVLLTSSVHQLFGRYNGTVVTDEGECITVEQVIGFAEEHHARW